MDDHEHGLPAAEILFDAELDRLIIRFEGLLEVCKLLEERGATEQELDEHRRELEKVSCQLAALVARPGNGRARRIAA
jgi:hypothetical protein